MVNFNTLRQTVADNLEAGYLGSKLGIDAITRQKELFKGVEKTDDVLRVLDQLDTQYQTTISNINTRDKVIKGLNQIKDEYLADKGSQDASTFTDQTPMSKGHYINRSNSYFQRKLFDLEVGKKIDVEKDRLASIISDNNVDTVTKQSAQRQLDIINNNDTAFRVGVQAGGIVGDIGGHGTQKLFWGIHPLDALTTYVPTFIKEHINPDASNFVLRGTTGVLGASTGAMVGSGMFNPLNFSEGGRGRGRQATSPDEYDPRRSTSPVADYILGQVMLGRQGRLLPWEQFHQEMPEVDYETYQHYKDWLSGRTDDWVNDMTLGLVKADAQGLTEPELRVLGFPVTPSGIAGATIGGVGAYSVLNNLDKIAEGTINMIDPSNIRRIV